VAEVGAGDEVGSVLVSTGRNVAVDGGTVSVVGGTSVATEKLQATAELRQAARQASKARPLRRKGCWEWR
jgi:hypothetical protein